MATVVGMIVKQPLVTLVYTGTPPHPFPPVTDPTPEEAYLQAESEKQIQRAEKDVRHAQQQQQPAKGFLASATKLVSQVSHVVEQKADELSSVAEKKIRDHMDSKDQQTFLLEFPQLASAGEKLVCAYQCKVMHQGLKVPGTVLVTNQSLLFTSELFKDIVLLNDIVSLQPSFAMKTFHDGPPYILSIPIPSVIPNCLQVFTNSRKQIFQFLDVTGAVPQPAVKVWSGPDSLKGTPVERLYNFVDHVWRAAVGTVPVPKVQYAPMPAW
eukprot:PhF_6_TR22287/c0_g1_i1/m.31530